MKRAKLRGGDLPTNLNAILCHRGVIACPPGHPPGDPGARLHKIYSMFLSEKQEGANFGANGRDRTDGPRFTKALLYQLSYIGVYHPGF